MRKYIIFLLLLPLYANIKAQYYDASNSMSRVALVYFYEDENGFFQKKENVNLQEVYSIESSYGYNKKSHELYVQTNRANCIILVNENLHKIIKKSKSIPQLKAEDLLAKSNAISQELTERFERQNKIRQKQIADSLEQARIDSIIRAREDSLRIVAEKNKEESYRKNHKWYMVPINKKSLYCSFCEESYNDRDSIFCYGIHNDTIYWAGFKTGLLDIDYRHIHAAKLPESLLKDEDFIYHQKVYNDSLTTRIILDKKIASVINSDYYYDYGEELKKVAPNGLFLDWDWKNEYSNIEFNFTYLNTNKKTIKYIEAFFIVTNDVGDVRKTGSFKGTGPLEEWESASWKWDHSSYYVSGDASYMKISKVIITYMNGTKVTIPRDKLRFN